MIVKPLQKMTKAHITVVVDLLAPGPFPDQDSGFGPHPGAHRDSGSKHGKQVDFLHHEAGTVLDYALWDWLVGLRGDRHISFTPDDKHLKVGNILLHFTFEVSFITIQSMSTVWEFGQRSLVLAALLCGFLFRS